MTECEKEAYQILRNVLWLNEEDHEELYEEFILAVSQALQKKQDEIERLKKELEDRKPYSLTAMERFKDSSILNQRKLNYEIQSLTARNKELQGNIEDFKKSEKAFLETINQQGDEIKELKEDIKVQEDEIEQYIKQWGDAVDCKIELLKKIEESREVIKSLRQALSGRTVSCEACNGMAEKVKELESKLAAAREALIKISECSGSTGIYDAKEIALAELGEKL